MLTRDTATSVEADSVREAGGNGTAATDTATSWIATLVVEDGQRAPAGAQTRSEFLDHLRPELEAMVSAEMAGTGWRGVDCPWIAFYVERYRARPFPSWQRLADVWLPESRPVDATSLRAAIVERARRGVQEWRRGGSPLPPTPIGAGEAPPPVLRWALPGAGPVDGRAARLAYELGPGEPLPSAVKSRFAPEVGGAGSVRLHRGAAAHRAAGAVGARAFAVGDDIAFGPGEFAPGTLSGDAIIAHELHHAVAGGRDAGTDERAADRAARSALGRLWGGEAVAAPSSDPPRRGRGLALRRCGDLEGDEEQAGPTVIPEAEMIARGIRLHAPEGEPVVGRSYTVRMSTPDVIRAPGSIDSYAFTRWYVGHGGADPYRRQAIGRSHTLTLDAEGEWTIVAEVPMGPNTVGRIWHRVTARPAGAVAETQLSGIRSTDLVGFQAGLELRSINLARLGLQEQRTGPTYITVSGPNPADPHANFPNIPSNRYTVHTPDGVTASRYQWVAAPEDLSDYPTRERFGQRRGTFAGIEGFDLGTSPQAHWDLAIETGVVLIHCLVYDAAGVELGHARYRQVVLERAEREAYNRFSAYARAARAELRKLREDTAAYVPAVHVANETGTAMELSFFMGQSASSGAFLLLDVTPGVKRREYSGTDFAAALQDLNLGNSYPDGILRLRVETNALGVTPEEWVLTTHGASLAETLSTTTGWASLGLAGLGALSLVIPGAQPLAPVFFFASAATGAVSAGASLYQQSLEVEPSPLRAAIDIVGLAGSLIGMAGAANILRHGSRVAALNRTGRFVLYTGFATDAVGGVLLAADSVGQIADILDGRGTSEEKSSAIVRILSGLLLNGALLGWGARDFGAARRQLQDRLGATIAGQLRTADVHALSVLEGAALGRLVGAPVEEVRAVAELIRSDPARATQLVRQFGEDFVVGARGRPSNLDELEQALAMGVPEAAGTRGSYGADPGVGGVRPTYIERAGVGEASPNNLWSRVRAQFVNTQQRPLRDGARLYVAGTPAPGAAHTRFELRIPADGARPAQTIPVTIESTAVRPTSVHGEETGPARMRVRSTAAGGYEVSIEVHRDLGREEIANAVGHELDEAVGIALRGVRGNDITAQKRASLLRRFDAGTGTAPPVSAHDEAAARELAQVAPPQNQRPADGSLPPALESRALEMGFGNAINLEDKCALLVRQGVDQDLVRRLRTLAHISELRIRAPAATTFRTPRVVSHLLHARPGSPASPVGGGHLESQLRAQWDSLGTGPSPVRLVDAQNIELDAAGIRYRAYEQWQWAGGGAGPPVGSAPPAAAVGVPETNVGGWRLAPEPKTTFDDLTGFLVRAEDAWGQWSAIQANADVIAAGGNNLIWEFTLTTGETIAGRFGVTAGGVVHISVYPYRTGGLATW